MPPQWLRLARKIAGRMSDVPVAVRDLGADGAFLTAARAFVPGSEEHLTFVAGAHEVSIGCIVMGVAEFWSPARTTPTFEVLLRFPQPTEAVQAFVQDQLDIIRRAEEANAAGEFEQNRLGEGAILSDLGAALRDENVHVLEFRRVAGRWQRVSTNVRRQPADGFTISAHESEEQIRLLQLAYDEADEDGRRLIREFAAMSIQPEPAPAAAPSEVVE